MLTTLIRTDSAHADFIRLVKRLDADLARRDGPDHSFYSQFNKVDNIRCVVLAYHHERPIGCGAIKHFSETAMEVKRMYVEPELRKMRIATALLYELERWAGELGYSRCILETGRRQPEAIALYERNGYYPIANYGPYEGVENSLCFEKKLWQVT